MASDSQPLSEAFGPLHLTQHLEVSELDGGRTRATLLHDATSVMGAVPLPVWLMESRCVLDVHADGKGYDLDVQVRLCGWSMVTYSGSLRELEGRPVDLLSAQEAKAFGGV